MKNSMAVLPKPPRASFGETGILLCLNKNSLYSMSYVQILKISGLPGTF